jgi:hypothetical protein
MATLNKFFGHLVELPEVSMEGGREMVFFRIPLNSFAISSYSRSDFSMVGYKITWLAFEENFENN